MMALALSYFTLGSLSLRRRTLLRRRPIKAGPGQGAAARSRRARPKRGDQGASFQNFYDQLGSQGQWVPDR